MERRGEGSRWEGVRRKGREGKGGKKERREKRRSDEDGLYGYRTLLHARLGTAVNSIALHKRPMYKSNMAENPEK